MFSFVNFLYGIILATMITILIRPGKVKPNLKRLPVFLIAIFRYMLLLLVDLFKGGIQTARIVLDPKLPIQTGFIQLPTECQSDLATALSMHALTLTPGELVVRVDSNNEFLIHAFIPPCIIIYYKTKPCASILPASQQARLHRVML